MLSPNVKCTAMISRILLALVLGFASVASAQTPPRPKKYALLIGLDRYQSNVEGVPSLRFAVADADSLKKELDLRGYDEVTVLRNDGAERGDILAELYRLAAIVKKEDSFLLFFAGHGVRNQVFNDKIYWLTYDAELSRLDINGIRLEHLMDYVQDIKAGRKLILLDHCFSGDIVPALFGHAETRGVALAPDTTTAGPALHGFENNVTLQRNIVPANFTQQIQNKAAGMVVIAAAHNQALESARLGHGVFTAVLLEALKSRLADTINNDAQLSIEELKNYLYNTVPRLARTEANFEQRITEFTVGVDLTNWYIADNLPIEEVVETGQKAEEYLVTLERWAGQNWISAETKTVCRLALKEWKRAGQALDETNANILREIRAHMELRNYPEEWRARDLEEEVSKVINRLNV